MVDVREDPYHAFLGVYTKAGLEARLGGRYVWVRELGNRTRDFPPMFVDEEAGLNRLRELLARRGRVALLCAERDEERCHRGYIKVRVEAG